LLFLTNKRSNQEVVCQVLRKRSFQPGQSYVELLFTEERLDYWGVEFPEKKQAGPEFKAEEQVQAEETTAEHPEQPVPAHSAQDVARLKKEVEGLRDQLAALEKQNVEAAAAKAMAEAAAAKETREAAARELAMQEATRAMEAMTAGVTKHVREELAGHPASAAPGKMPVEADNPALLMPAAKDKHEAPRPVVGMSLPVWRNEKSPEEQLLEEEASRETKAVAKPKLEASEDLLPKPELDFSQVPKSAPKGKGKIPKWQRSPRAGIGKARTVGLSAFLVVLLAGGVWYGKWWTYLPLGNKAAAPRATVAKPSAPRTAPAVVNAVGTAGAAGTTVANAGAGAVATARMGAAGKDLGKDKTSGSAVTVPASEQTAAETPAEKPAESEAAAADKTASWRERLLGKKKAEKTAEKTEEAASAAEVVPSDAPVLPAKLMKTVNPYYPPDAMRSYITGDVKAEVVVGASGHVGEVKVLSGPQALREAAVAALKQYEYAPATQGGKAVESKAVEVVKFWFNP
jgi:TonB family protein